MTESTDDALARQAALEITLFDFAKLILQGTGDFHGDRALLTALAQHYMNTVSPNGEAVLGIDDNGELVCGHCGSREFRWEEQEGTWRTMSSNENHIITVVWDLSNHDDGDSNPGLVCDCIDGANGCGRPVVLPEGFEIEFD